MKNRKLFSIIAIVLSIILLIISIIAKKLDIFEAHKTLFGIIIGVASGLFGGGVGNLINIVVLNSNPNIKKKSEIELNDERNNNIRNSAKAKAFDAMSFILPVTMLIHILLNVDLSITIISIVSYLVIYIVLIYYINLYYKKM